MKEASGELSMTAVAVVAIAAVGVLFTTLIWPSIKNSLVAGTRCASAFNCCDDATESFTAKSCKCDYYGENGNVITDGVTCPNNDVNRTTEAAATGDTN